MDKSEEINRILGITESYKAPERLLEIVLDHERFKKVAQEMLNLHKRKLNYDWFHEYFQNEHADRKKKKQDFTPAAVGELLALLTGRVDGVLYEPATGTGGVIIELWNQAVRKYGISIDPAARLFFCEELSERAIPFLLFNLAIRGVNAIVVRCNVLSREATNFYHVYNEKNDFMAISSVIELPKEVGKERVEKISRFRYELVDKL